jgi:hypothetical protein
MSSTLGRAAATVGALVLVVGLAGCGKPRQRPSLELPLIVVRAPTAAKWVSLLRASGAASRIGTLDEAIRRGAAVVPAHASLPPDGERRLRALVTDGGRLVTADGDLLRALDFGFGSLVRFDRVTVEGLPGVVRWPSSYGVRPLVGSPPRRIVHPLARHGRSIVLASARLGRGRVLASALDPFQFGLTGHEVLPLLGRQAASLTAAPRGPRRYGAEIYLDPGSVSGTPEQLAGRLSDAVAVHVAGWNVGFLDPSFDYPYQRLIAALHARGVRVYAWLEPPFVDSRMWNDHPECREKTSQGRDAVDDWRSLIALENDRCFKIAWRVWRNLLARFDFDGVNVAELYFASPSLPYHPSALVQFGKNPATNPQEWLRFRRDLVVRLNRKIVERIRSLGKPLDVELTVIDDQLDPKLGRRVGSDIERLAQAARDGGATLQVEDPYTTWTRGPSRYAVLSRSIAALMPPQRSLLDINVVPRAYAYPTATMTGAELDLSIANASSRSGRVALFSAGTLLPGDLGSVAGAVAGAAVTGDTYVDAPWSVVVSAPEAGHGRFLLDGKPWPAAHGRAIVPAGRHTVSWLAGDDGRPGLLRLAGNLLAERATGKTLDVSYDALASAWSVVDRRPSSLMVDGRKVALSVAADPDGGFAVRLPAGRHDVRFTF